MPEWPDGGADNVASVAVIEGNIAQALGHLDNMNASCRQPRKGLSTGIGTADISNIAHTLTMTPMQASKKGLELPWRSQQPFKVPSAPPWLQYCDFYLLPLAVATNG